MSSLSDINSLVDKRYDTYQVLKRKYGVIKKVINDSRAVVTLEDTDMLKWQKEYKRREKEKQEAIDHGEEPPEYNNDGTRDLVLPNASGESLAVADGVWVYYWHDLASGYIAVKNGVAKIGSTDLLVEKLAVLNTVQGNIYAHAKKHDAESEWDSQAENESWQENYDDRTMNIDEKNNLIIAQGEQAHGYNIIFVNGMPCVVGYNSAALVRPSLFGQHLIVRIQTSISQRTFTNTSYITTSYTLDPTRDTRIFVSPIRIATDGDKQYFFGCLIEQDGRIDTLFTSGIPFGYVVPTVNDIRLFLEVPVYPTLNEPETNFPYGSISGRLSLYNISDYYALGSMGVKLGFGNEEEYEYSKCVISQCGYQIIT